MIAVASPARREAASREQTRARYPDSAGTIERAGVELFYEVYGAGEPAVVLVPTWSIVHSRIWKAQIPDLARRHRVVTLDPRGNGRAGRPPARPAYDETEFAEDIVAVMDAAGLDRAVLVSLSRGAQRALIAATHRPERVSGLAFIAPAIALADPHPERTTVARFEAGLDSDEGWASYSVDYWRSVYPEYLEDFFERCFSEAHSTKHIEDAVGWGAEIGAEGLVLATRGRGIGPRERVLELTERVRCPVLVIHGDDDRVIPHAAGAELARVTGGRLVTIHGGGHLPNARQPVLVNLLLREFVRQVGAAG
jgi:pimeloyl-ACP methyl ester carboxylesterase